MYVTHVSGHFLALDYVTGPLAHAIGTTTTMKHRTVRSRTTRESVALDHTLETTAFACADDVDFFSRFEAIYCKYIANIEVGSLFCTEFT